MKQLATLDLHDNLLTAMPEAMGELSELECLDVNVNRLTALPQSLERLHRLRYLYLGSNRLEQCPESVPRFGELEELDLSWNADLRSLPLELAKMPKLRTPWVEGCGIPQATLDELASRAPDLRIR